jgi:zinc/manganese transport system permease protein
VSAAEASQAVGALLLFGLLAAPPAAAQRLTARPWSALALAGLLSVLALWLGIGFSYAWGQLPPSFTIMAVSTAEYLLAALWASARARRPVPA